MRKLVVSLACGALLIGGFLFTNKQYEDTASLEPSPTAVPTIPTSNL
ncbi:hypothetical protein [Virgibacillus proomii]|nr:hypothetical protein [Virgibacillus proomii]MBU5266783.1 hypothetical protein [Virgibacillus proomii]